MASIQDTIFTYIEPTVASLGLELWGVELQKGSLTVYIDKDNGVDVDDCSSASEAIETILAVEERLADCYEYITVSSPGADRKFFSLSQCAKFIGSRVTLSLRLPQENRRKWEGKLLEVTETSLILDVREVAAPTKGKKGAKKSKASKATSQEASLEAQATLSAEEQALMNFEVLFTNIDSCRLKPEF